MPRKRYLMVQGTRHFVALGWLDSTDGGIVPPRACLKGNRVVAKGRSCRAARPRTPQHHTGTMLARGAGGSRDARTRSALRRGRCLADTDLMTVRPAPVFVWGTEPRAAASRINRTALGRRSAGLSLRPQMNKMAAWQDVFALAKIVSAVRQASESSVGRVVRDVA